MPRPRTIDADCIQTFHCSYVLRTALLKSAATTMDANVSSFMRNGLEVACQKALGHDRWIHLQSASNRQIRRTLLESFLGQVDVTQIRRCLDAARGVKPHEKMDDLLFRTVDDYIRTFERARDDRDVDLALAVALEEAIDTIQKMKTILLRTNIAKSAAESLQQLASRFPDSLRADLEAAILNRIVANQVEPA